MNRRRFLKGALFAGSAVAVGGGLWLGASDARKSISIQSTLSLLDDIVEQPYVATGDWSLVKIFHHCAQSVEYSMSGYPTHKSDWFKHTVGRAAFSFFQYRGKMMHPLNEPIPEAPALPSQGDLSMAVARLKQALMGFQQHKQAFAPHFAFGTLTKAEYEQAHVMHFNNHLQEVVLAS